MYLLCCYFFILSFSFKNTNNLEKHYYFIHFTSSSNTKTHVRPLESNQREFFRLIFNILLIKSYYKRKMKMRNDEITHSWCVCVFVFKKLMETKQFFSIFFLYVCFVMLISCTKDKDLSSSPSKDLRYNFIYVYLLRHPVAIRTKKKCGLWTFYTIKQWFHLTLMINFLQTTNFYRVFFAVQTCSHVLFINMKIGIVSDRSFSCYNGQSYSAKKILF